MRRWSIYTTLSLFAWIVVYMGLRLTLGQRPYTIAYGLYPGLEMFKRNIASPDSYRQLLLTVMLLPLAWIANWRSLRFELKRFALVLIVPYLVVMACAGMLRETRLFLVPIALVIIPGSLMAPGSTRR